MNNLIFHYYVEGECEKKLIDELKKIGEQKLVSGKVEILNVTNQRISKARLLALKKNTIVILVYDTDKNITHILEENIKLLKDAKFEILHIQSVRNFEDEIVFSTSLKRIQDLFYTEGVTNFKRRFISHQDIISKLNSVNFDYLKLWSRVNIDKPFSKYSNKEDLNKIKINKI